MTHGDSLPISEIRNLEEGDYIVAELHEDEYWMQGEGRIESVHTNEDGSMRVRVRSNDGRHVNTLKVPADGRRPLRFNGAARGAHNLHVTDLYLRKTY